MPNNGMMVGLEGTIFYILLQTLKLGKLDIIGKRVTRKFGMIYYKFKMVKLFFGKELTPGDDSFADFLVQDGGVTLSRSNSIDCNFNINFFITL